MTDCQISDIGNGFRLLSVKDISTLTGLGVRTLWRWRSEGKMPPPDFKLGKSIRWKASTIQAWIDAGGLYGVPQVITTASSTVPLQNLLEPLTQITFRTRRGTEQLTSRDAQRLCQEFGADAVRSNLQQLAVESRSSGLSQPLYSMLLGRLRSEVRP